MCLRSDFANCCTRRRKRSKRRFTLWKLCPTTFTCLLRATRLWHQRGWRHSSRDSRRTGFGKSFRGSNRTSRVCGLVPTTSLASVPYPRRQSSGTSQIRGRGSDVNILHRVRSNTTPTEIEGNSLRWLPRRRHSMQTESKVRFTHNSRRVRPAFCSKCGSGFLRLHHSFCHARRVGVGVQSKRHLEKR